MCQILPIGDTNMSLGAQGFYWCQSWDTLITDLSYSESNISKLGQRGQGRHHELHLSKAATMNRTRSQIIWHGPVLQVNKDSCQAG